MKTIFQPTLPVLDSKSEPPSLFDGTPRLYIGLTCPYAQRVWAVRNFKGLQDIELVAINLRDKPSWYSEKVYPAGKVPSLEHNGKVVGESLDLLEYIEQNFPGPSLLPTDPVKQEEANELLRCTDTLRTAAITVLKLPELNADVINEVVGPTLNFLEAALGKFADEGPFFIGQLSVVDFAYIPFLERYHMLFSEWGDCDITEGRPKITRWMKVMNELEAYTSTKSDPKVLIDYYKKMLGK
eukprot:c47156_g1_i1 orf=232-951(+)